MPVALNVNNFCYFAFHPNSPHLSSPHKNIALALTILMGLTLGLGHLISAIAYRFKKQEIQSSLSVQITQVANPILNQNNANSNPDAAEKNAHPLPTFLVRTEQEASKSKVETKSVEQPQEQELVEITDERTGNKFTLPKYVFSKVDSLSIGNLFYHLEETNPANRNEIILWSFTQRKFLSSGSMSDTVDWGKHELKRMDPVEGLDGYAKSLSAHPVDSTIFIADADIKRIDACERFEFLKPTFVKGYFADGKCMLQQPAVRSCGPTSLAMLLMDRGIDFDIGYLFSTNLCNDKDMSRWAHQYGYKCEKLDGCFGASPDIEKVKLFIETNGSLLASIDAQDLGGHYVVVDSIDNDQVTIRDPAHGWRVTIDTAFFFAEMHPEFKGLTKE